MIILFANQKGGVGKSTLALTFSNYLVGMKQTQVAVFDMDFQKSLFNKAESDRVLNNDSLYPVDSVSLPEFKKQILKKSNDNFNKIHIVDIPGKLDDDNLVPVFQNSDIIVTPFSYDEYSVHSTIQFSYVVKHINPKASLILIPNRIRKGVRYETLQSVNSALEQFGLVTNPIHERIDFQRLTIFGIPETLLAEVEPVFEILFNEVLKINMIWKATTT